MVGPVTTARGGGNDVICLPRNPGPLNGNLSTINRPSKALLGPVTFDTADAGLRDTFIECTYCKLPTSESTVSNPNFFKPFDLHFKVENLLLQIFKL